MPRSGEEHDDHDAGERDEGGRTSSSEGGPPRRRGRQPNRWPEGLGPGDLEAYRRRFGLSERRLADHLGVSVPTLRSWTKGGKAPAPERHAAIRAKLQEPYVAPATPGAPPRRPGRPPRLPAAVPDPAAPAVEAPPGAPEPAAPERTRSTAQAIAELAAAYLRTPGGQHLTPEELISLLERIRRTVE